MLLHIVRLLTYAARILFFKTVLSTLFFTYFLFFTFLIARIW